MGPLGHKATSDGQSLCAKHWQSSPGECVAARNRLEAEAEPIVTKPEPQYGDRNGWRNLPLPSADPYQLARKDGGPDYLDRQATDALPGNVEARKRLVAALAAEQRIPMAQRKAALEKRFGPRKGVDDTGGWSGSSYED